MKNKGVIIGLIVFLSILVIFLTFFLITVIRSNKRFTFFGWNYKVSNELVLDEIYDRDFEKIKIVTNASDIEIKDSQEENMHVIIYGDKEHTIVEQNQNELSISSKSGSCFGFCFNLQIAKIEIYLPSNYQNSIQIQNDYGDIEIGNLKDAQIEIHEKSGDVKIRNGHNISIENNYGDIEITQANTLDIKASAGDVSIGTANDIQIQNNYGDIKIDTVLNSLTIVEDCGDVKIQNLILHQDSSIRNSYGDIKIGSTNDIAIQAHTSLGDTKIDKNNSSADTILKIENSCGDIIVQNQ